MAHKKGVGSTDNGRDSKSKRLGIKLFGGQKAMAGNILVRQRGTEYHPGQNVYMGRDHTLHAAIDGVVVFRRSKNDRRYISVLPFETVETPVKPTPPKPESHKPEDSVTPGTPAPSTGPEAGGGRKKSAAAAKKEAVEMPVIDTPVIETAVAEAPVVETPVVEPPVVEAPVVETPVIEPPVVEAPVVEPPVMETPVASLIDEEPDFESNWDSAPVAAAEEENALAPVAETPKSKPAKTPALNDLKIVEGIGPKIEQLLKDGGIDTWEGLASAEISRLREILEAAGSRYQMHDPSTWPAQARFAAEGKWEELKEYQEMLIGGRNAD